VMKRGCALSVAPYGQASNSLYSALPIRYLLYELSTGYYVTAHANAPYTFLSVPPGRFCLNVMVGDCVVYGRVLVEVRDEKKLEVSVPCVDPGEFRIIVKNYSVLEPARVVVVGLPSDIVDHWGGTHDTTVVWQ